MSDPHCDELFLAMVDSVGVKAFAGRLGLSTRQIHRMLGGTQPNPLARLCEALAACEPAAAEAGIDCMARRMGGYFVRLPGSLEQANVNAVKEAAEAIVAISEGESVDITVREIREAIAALAALERRLGGAPCGTGPTSDPRINLGDRSDHGLQETAESRQV